MKKRSSPFNSTAVTRFGWTAKRSESSIRAGTGPLQRKGMASQLNRWPKLGRQQSQLPGLPPLLRPNKSQRVAIHEFRGGVLVIAALEQQGLHQRLGFRDGLFVQVERAGH